MFGMMCPVAIILQSSQEGDGPHCWFLQYLSTGGMPHMEMLVTVKLAKSFTDPFEIQPKSKRDPQIPATFHAILPKE